MRKVLAALDGSPAAAPVLAAAAALAELLGAAVEAVHVRARTPAERAAAAAAAAGAVSLRTLAGPVVPALLAAAREPEVAALVVAGGGPLGPTVRALLAAVETPVAVVPAAARPGPLRRLLVPLDGTEAAAAGVRDTVDRARAAGLELVVLHVREPERVPPFLDQPHHELAAWAEEFLARNCGCAPGEAELRLRVGDRCECCLEAAAAGVDLAVLAWARDLSAERAPVVRALLEQASVPLLLVPAAPQPQRAPLAARSAR